MTLVDGLASGTLILHTFTTPAHRSQQTTSHDFLNCVTLPANANRIYSSPVLQLLLAVHLARERLVALTCPNTSQRRG